MHGISGMGWRAGTVGLSQGEVACEYKGFELRALLFAASCPELRVYTLRNDVASSAWKHLGEKVFAITGDQDLCGGRTSPRRAWFPKARLARAIQSFRAGVDRLDG